MQTKQSLIYRVTLVILGAAEGSSLRGVLIYNWYQSEDHLSMILISQSGRPTAAAVEATPTRKVWPLRLWKGSPTRRTISRRREMTADLVRSLPDWKKKRGAWRGCDKLKIMLHGSNHTDLGSRASSDKGLTQPKGVSLRGPKCNN